MHGLDSVSFRVVTSGIWALVESTTRLYLFAHRVVNLVDMLGLLRKPRAALRRGTPHCTDCTAVCGAAADWTGF